MLAIYKIQPNTAKTILKRAGLVFYPSLNILHLPDAIGKEEAFLKYWEANRARQKKLMYQLLVGLPVGLLLGAAITFNFYSGWYKRADMIANGGFNPFVLIVAVLGIAIFVAIFSKKFQWEQSEQKYMELTAKKNKTKLQPSTQQPEQPTNP